MRLKAIFHERDLLQQCSTNDLSPLVSNGVMRHLDRNIRGAETSKLRGTHISKHSFTNKTFYYNAVQMISHLVNNVGIRHPETKTNEMLKLLSCQGEHAPQSNLS